MKSMKKAPSSEEEEYDNEDEESKASEKTVAKKKVSRGKRVQIDISDASTA